MDISINSCKRYVLYIIFLSVEYLQKNIEYQSIPLPLFLLQFVEVGNYDFNKNTISARTVMVKGIPPFFARNSEQLLLKFKQIWGNNRVLWAYLNPQVNVLRRKQQERLRLATKWKTIRDQSRTPFYQKCGR